MAFKIVRDFTEQLKLIGYQEKIPLSVLTTLSGNERSFAAYANILLWLVNCLDSDVMVHHESRSESDRVMLIREATEFLAVSAGIKLNPRKLYASNCATSKELMKVTTALMNLPQKPREDDNQSMKTIEDSVSNDEIRKIRSLSTDLTSRGVNLYDLISKETVNSDLRLLYMKPLELKEVDKLLRQSIQTLKNDLQLGRSTIESQITERSSLESKIERKQSELERVTHRLATLQRIRPAYLEEFDKIELQMIDLYRQYTIRARCYEAMKQLLSKFSSSLAVFAAPQKAQENSIPFLSEEDLPGDDEDHSLLNQDIFKQVSDRLVTRRERRNVGGQTGSKTIDDLSSESSPDSEELESGELEFIDDMDKVEDNFKKEKSDEDF